jgi:hypothetical protein
VRVLNFEPPLHRSSKKVALQVRPVLHSDVLIFKDNAQHLLAVSWPGVIRAQKFIFIRSQEREIFIDNLLVRDRLIIEMSRPALRHGSLNSLFQVALHLPS